MGLEKLENTIDGWFKKFVPFKLPQETRKGLAGAFWWIALVLGILQLWAAWGLWHLAHYLGPLNRTVDYINNYYGHNVIDNSLNFFYYSAVVVLVADAVILLLASPGLKAFKKVGWNFLFYSLLLNVAYGVVRAFSDVGGGFGTLLWTALVSIVTAFFVFQVREYFTTNGKPVVNSKKESEPKK